MICSTCNSQTDTLRTVIRKGMILDGCDNCIDQPVSHSQNDIAKYNRQRDYDDHKADLVQPFENRDYIKARGIDAARAAGASDEDIRRLA